jgi:alkylation response protein AidB-like acyl-CoA dehydrogenase
MDFSFSPEHEAFRKTVRTFAEEVVAPRARELDERAEFPTDIVLRMGELGLLGLPYPEEYGGSGADFVSVCIAIEELARVDASVALTLEAALGLGSMPIYRYGSEEQRRRWLVPLARGEALAAFALTEPDGGSDTRHIRTRATLEDGAWVIRGAKAFITNSGTPLTRVLIVAAVTGGDASSPEISAILVPAGTPGLEVGPSYRKMAWRASDTHPLAFDGCRVPEENLLGERGAGHRYFLEVLDGGRVALGALAVGLAQGCLEQSVAYAKERRAFGRPIAEHQAVAFMLADMAVRTDLARLGVYRAAWMADQGLPFRREAAVAKLFASEQAVEVARQAVQIHGGYGVTDEFPVSRFYRDAKALEIGEGTSEVQRIVIARSFLGRGPA